MTEPDLRPHWERDKELSSVPRFQETQVVEYGRIIKAWRTFDGWLTEWKPRYFRRAFPQGLWRNAP